MNPLFGQADCDAAKVNLVGDIWLMQPVRLYVVGALLLLSVILIALVLCFGDYTDEETASGIITLNKAIAKVYADSPGYYSETMVTAGQRVSKGQPLFRVSAVIVSDGRALVKDKQRNELQHQLALVDKRIAADEVMRANQKLTTQSRLDNLDIQMDSLKSELQIQQQLAELARQEHDYFKALYDQQRLSTLKYSQSERRMLDTRLSIEKQQSRLAQLRGEKQQLQLAYDNIDSHFDNELDNIKQQRSGIKIKLTNAQKQAAYTVHAPISGIVGNLEALAGAGVDSSRPSLTIVPDGACYLARLYVTSKAIGLIHQGQPIKLRYDAFPYQKFGIQHGTISFVSPSTSLGKDNGTPHYLVEATLDKQTVAAYGKEVSLVPGMTLAADIVIDRRSLLEWLFEPLYTLGGET